MNKWRGNLQFNMKTKGLPKLINKEDLGSGFEHDTAHIIGDAKSYFAQDPTVWRFPAKNYFVRICLAHYVAGKFHEDMYDLMNDDELLPYDDAYSPAYDFDKEAYDKIIYGVDIENSYGYKKTVEVFGYLYDDIIKEKSITIGYNLTGQDFFDTICFKKKYIHEFFFSLTHRMPRQPLNTEDIIRRLSSANTYGIPGNLVLNTDESQGDWAELLKMAMGATTVRAATVLDIASANKVKDAFPELKLHISTHGAQKIDPAELDASLIEAVNICEPYFYEERDLMNACKEKGIKIKYIVNRGCVVGKHEKMSALCKQAVMCCQDYQCKQLLTKVPWMDLIRVNLYKESLQHYLPDLIKISTREQTNEEVKAMLDYWTSPAPTQRLCDIPITEKNYGVFLAWAKQRYHCDGNCLQCMKCKGFYEKLVSA